MSISAKSETDLIGHIYDAVIEPSRWPDTIGRIRRHFDFHIAMIGVNALPSGNVIIEASSNVPDYYVKSVGKYGAEALDLWGGPKQLARLPTEEPMLQTRHTKPSDWIGNAFYEEWARPQGLVDQMVIVLESNPSMLATLGMGVHESMPPVSETQIEGMRVLAPHLRRAVIISGLLEGRAEAAASFEAALSALGSAVLLVDESMHIVYANGKAEHMLHGGDPIALLHGRLDVPRQLVAGQIEAAVAGSVGDDGKLSQSGSGIAARRRDGTGAIVHVLPLHRRLAHSNGRAVAAVFVAEASAPMDLPTEAIKLLYGLRPAETRVFELIVAGLSGRRIAEALGVAPSTVKTHTLRLFEKLGNHSRAGVVQFAREVSLGRRGGDPA